ncbi:hypothetical protein SDC9_167603 [bioreactor metagenome]|uniref:Uncharacterized protein n=1 Tax=bioreactor metagenome TaxID=1076179 RepID=A0A645G0R2_9ZZZZ
MGQGQRVYSGQQGDACPDQEWGGVGLNLQGAYQ